jgi:hydrogenase maturation protease
MSDGDAGSARILLIGFGDADDGDIGVGARALAQLVQRFELPDYVQPLFANGVDAALLDVAEDASYVLVTDAVVATEPPGSIIRVPLDEFERPGEPPESLHEREVLEGLGVLEMLGGRPPAILLAMQVANRTAAAELSPEVTVALPALVERLVEELVRLGVPVAPRRVL